MEDLDADLIGTLCEEALSEKCNVATGERLTRALQVAAGRPYLLDPHLAAWAAPVILRLQTWDAAPDDVEKAAFVFQLFCLVRGPAVMAKLLPHEMHVLVQVADRLQGHVWRWEARYVLLLWLAELALLPLPLDRITPDAGVSLLELGQSHLIDASGKPAMVAGIMLARLVTRPDGGHLLAPFMHWCVLPRQGEQEVAVMRAVAAVLRAGSRTLLKPFLNTFFWKVEGSSALRRRMAVKIQERAGLVHLAPRVVAWRYQRGKRILLAGLAAPPQGLDKQKAPPPVPEILSSAPVTWKVPMELDVVMNCLLESLRDKDTVVRWQAAKGIGRLTERLPEAFADLVVEALLELCSPAEEESAWHGSCLALAEMARRGLLLPHRLTEALPAVLEALRFDRKAGTRSVGSNVRDAACYVLWASARAYAPAVLEPHALLIAGALLEASLLDREVNVRRAASAALQEHVGRTGLPPHGLELVALTDYHSLGTLRSAEESCKTALAMPEYGAWLTQALLQRKVGHWDSAVREMAARLLGCASALECCRLVVMEGMPKLRASCFASDADDRHGALLALGFTGAVLPGVVELCTVVPLLDTLRLFRGKGGQLVRVGACVYVQRLSEACVPLEPINVAELKTHLKGRPDSGKSGAKRHKEFLDECFRASAEDVQTAAAAALSPFTISYLSQLDAKVRIAVVNTYVKALNAESPSHARGAGRALAALPDSFFEPEALDEMQSVIVDVMRTSSDPETRKGALQALRPHGPAAVSSIICGLQDYARDERGDVGSWVRETACRRLPDVLSSSSWTNKDVDAAISSVLAILAGRLDRLRGPALAALKALSQSHMEASHGPEIRELLSRFEESHWRLCCEALALKGHCNAVLLALCVSSGLRVPDPTSREELLRYMTAEHSLSTRRHIWENLASVIQLHSQDDRVIAHFLCALNVLVRNGCFDSVAVPNWTQGIFQAVWNAFSKSHQIQLILTGVDLICGLFRFEGDFSQWVVALVSDMVNHRYPRIRQHSCLQLQVLFSEKEELCRDATTRERLLFILVSGSQSDGNVALQTAALLGIKLEPGVVAVSQTGEDEQEDRGEAEARQQWPEDDLMEKEEVVTNEKMLSQDDFEI